MIHLSELEVGVVLTRNFRHLTDVFPAGALCKVFSISDRGRVIVTGINVREGIRWGIELKNWDIYEGKDVKHLSPIERKIQRMWKRQSFTKKLEANHV